MKKISKANAFMMFLVVLFTMILCFMVSAM